MNAIHRRHKARQDLVEIFRYYAREAGLRVAQRFFAQVEATLTRLAGMPGMGTHYDLDHPALADLRFFPVSRFRMYLVFYRTVPGGMEIVRVLHGARHRRHPGRGIWRGCVYRRGTGRRAKRVLIVNYPILRRRITDIGHMFNC